MTGRWTNHFTMLFLAALVFAAACAHLVIDKSPDAFASGDYTLVSACSAVPSGGLDACYGTEGTKISSAWNMVLPKKSGTVLGTDIDVYYRDIHKAYSASGMVLTIPWADFFGTDTWGPQHDGVAMALAKVRWQDENGLEKVLLFRGYAKLIITKPGYARMPIDSGFAAFGATCKIQYSTAGRSAVSCK